MKLTVKDCMKLDAFQFAKVLAGEDRLSTPIRSISVMDAGDVKTAVSTNGVEGQLVLTSFYAMKDAGKRADTVKRLAKCGISALVVFHADGDLIPSDKLVQAAQEENLPLILIPDETHIEYSVVIEQVMNEFLVGDISKTNLINDTITHLMDFDKYTTFPQAIKEAAVSNDFQVVLLSKDFNPVLVVETRHNVTVADAVRSLQRRKHDADATLYPLLDIEGITAFWGVISVSGEDYFLLIVDNDEKYSAVDITKLAEIIELAIGMWKYSPVRDINAELMRALMRGNSALAYSLKEEMDIREDMIQSIFVAKGLSEKSAIKQVSTYEKKYKNQIIMVNDEDLSYGMIIGECTDESCYTDLYEALVDKSEDAVVCHYSGVDGIEGVVHGFKLINETQSFIDTIYPLKKVFSKYEMALVSNCISIQMAGGYTKKNYVHLLEPLDGDNQSNKSKQLMSTLETFVLDTGLSSNATAKAMGIHANTVQYRLKRINEILGVDITENNIVHSLTIALALRRLAKIIG